MEQLLSAFGIDWHLLLAQAVNFSIVLVALTYFLYKPVLEMLDKRRELVAKGVEDAKLAEEKLATADEEAASKLNVADTEAESIVADAREAATLQKTQIVRDAEERAAAIARDAEARAGETASKALRESEKEIARLAILAAEKVMLAKS
jgi:F-type H+-transporting ATPase subunit b